MNYDKNTPYSVVKNNQCRFYNNCKIDYPEMWHKERKKSGCTKETSKTCEFMKEWKE